MERIGDQLVELASLLLDEPTKIQAHETFKSLSDKIAETREAFELLEGRKQSDTTAP
jgi:hypothetical protein